MASIKENRDKAGEIVSYRVRVCIGRDERYRQIWRTDAHRRAESVRGYAKNTRHGQKRIQGK